ncbi:MAG: CoA transferase [Acidimicrobiales bacterium]
MPEGTDTGPLRGLRVVDATQTPDAIATSTLLADLGADVVQIETPAGHRSRAVGPMKDGVSLLWKVTARNKRCVQLSPAMPNSYAWFHQLMDRCDVVIVEPGLHFGTDAVTGDELFAHHPHLVVLSTSAFGATGPLHGRAGSGRVAEAFGGQTFAAGEPDRSPLHTGFPIGAATTALFGALSVMAAVLERDAHGERKGQLIDLAGYEAVLRVMEFLPIFFQQTGFRNERAGNGSSYQVPVATWLTADDKWMTFTGNTNEIVHRLYRAMGRPDLIDDPRFATNEARVANRAVVESTLRDWARSANRADIEEVCGRHSVPIGSVFTMDDIFDDQNYRERGTIARVVDDELGPCHVPRAVPRFSRTPGRVHHLGAARPLIDVAVDEVWSDAAPARPPAPAAVDHRRPARPTDRPGPLGGLRVIDMGQILAGPFAATVLADLGADVVKVEKPNGGDDFRRQAPLHKQVSLWWKASARNKRSITLDLKDPADRTTFLGLVAAADVITANFVPGTLERMGLGYDDLRAVNPRIVLVSVSGYGQDGPYRTRRAFGRNAEAYGGLASVTGYADGPPMPTGFPVADGLSALLGAFGALSALYEQRRGDAAVGQHVDVALYETIFRFLELPVLMYDQFAELPGRSSFGTAVGESICMAQSSDGRWMSAAKWGPGPVRFCDGDPYGDVDGFDRGAEIESIRHYVESHTADELIAVDDHPHGYSVTPVMSIDELFAAAHCTTRSSIVSVRDEELGEVALAAVVPKFSRTPGGIAHASPRLDEHRAQIIDEWLGAPPSIAAQETQR